jgi:hypothetical protein
VWASEKRAWVLANSSGSDIVLLSTQPVRQPMAIEPHQLPLVWSGGITGLDVTTEDVASVSSDPAGPGTSACTSLVVYLGPSLTPALRDVLAKHPETASHEVVNARGTAPGSVVVVDMKTGETDVKPSGRNAPAIAIVPTSYADGEAIMGAIASNVPGARLLCATPRR